MARVRPASTRVSTIGLATFVGAAIALLGLAAIPRAAEPEKKGRPEIEE